jgi:hypothetical protein
MKNIAEYATHPRRRFRRGTAAAVFVRELRGLLSLGPYDSHHCRPSSAGHERFLGIPALTSLIPAARTDTPRT